MNKQLGAIAIVVAAVAAAAGLFASPSKSATDYQVALTRPDLTLGTVRQASDTISVYGTGEVNDAFGPYLGFQGTASPFKQISFFGASDWHLTAINGLPGSKCSLTPTNGGGTCSFADPSMSVIDGRLAVDTHFSGTPPTTVAGEVVFADNSTATFSAPVSYPPPPRFFVAYISDGLFTGMKHGKPRLRFALNSRGDRYQSKLTSFVVTLPRGYGFRFNRQKVKKGAACHGPGQWKSSLINAWETRCTPLPPYLWAKNVGPTLVTTIGISAIHEDPILEQMVKEHKLMKLPFYITANDSNHGALHLRGIATIKN